MKRVLISIAVASAMFSGVAMAQSAKFAAVWDDGGEIIMSSDCDTFGTITDAWCTALSDLLAVGDAPSVASEIATIKVPNSKELLVGVSAQVELFTSTEVRGKKGATSTATAHADAAVDLFACNQSSEICYRGEPGTVVLAGRTQTLSATLGGVIESCTTNDISQTDGVVNSVTWDLADCEVEEEAIALALTTMGAHHFNFVFPNLPVGTYNVIARFMTAADVSDLAVTCGVEMEYCDPLTDGGAAGAAYAIVGKRMVTVQEVRAVKDEGGDPVVVDM